MGKIYRVNEFAKRIGKSAKTVRRWDREGLLPAKRHPSGHRYYDEADVRQILGGSPLRRKTVVYCRVSSGGQKDDLKRQVEAMEAFCLNAGIAVDDWITEIGGGMNFKRKRFLQLLSEIQQGAIERLLVAHQDRLCRFGFDYFEHLATENGCKIEVVNQESLSPKPELVQDLLAIVHSFSGRLSGLRRYEKSIKDEFLKP